MARNDLAALRADLGRLLKDTEGLQHAMGRFGKEAALEAAGKDVGKDLRLSGMRRKTRLGAGYDTGDPVILNLRPLGLWVLLQHGRRGTKPIKPRRNRAAKSPPRPRAVNVRGDWRANSMSKPSKGLRTLDAAGNAIERGLPGAAQEAMNELLEDVLGG